MATALLNRIARFFTMGGPRGAHQSKYLIQRIDVVRNKDLTHSFNAAIAVMQLRIAAHPEIFKRPFPQSRVKSVLHEYFCNQCLPSIDGYEHAKVRVAWHGCNAAAMRSICAYGIVDLRQIDGGYFGAGIYVTPHSGSPRM